jgi:hypothetical protein
VGNGETVLFWTDRWNGKNIADEYPRLFSFAKDKLCSVKSGMSLSDPVDAFHLPLSLEAMTELQALQIQLHNMTLSHQDDVWNMSCSKNGKCIPNKNYRMAFQHIPNHFPSQWIWKSKYMLKHDFFFANSS